MILEEEWVYASVMAEQQRRIQRLESGLRQAIAVIQANGVYQNVALRPLIDELQSILDNKS